MLSRQDVLQAKGWLEEQTKAGSILTPSLTATMVREFHPYGRHLSMILRNDLPHEVLDSNHFRKRSERRYDLAYDENLRYFMDNLLRNNSHVAMSENLSGPARLVASYHMNPNTRMEDGTHRYSGTWELDAPGGLDWARFGEYTDPRIKMVLEQIGNDLEMTQSNGELAYQRGCVIFTEFRGTIYWLNQVFNRQQYQIGDVSVVPFQLTRKHPFTKRQKLGGVSYQIREQPILPVLICTPAGEDGLDMEWATSLVHWDLNPNSSGWNNGLGLGPSHQQRRTFPKYTVLFPMMEEVPHHSAEHTILDRFNKRTRSSLPRHDLTSHKPQKVRSISLEPVPIMDSPYWMLKLGTKQILRKKLWRLARTTTSTIGTIAIARLI